MEMSSDEGEEEGDNGHLSHLGARASLSFQTVQQDSAGTSTSTTYRDCSNITHMGSVAAGKDINIHNSGKVFQQNIIQVQQQRGDVSAQGTSNVTIRGIPNIGKPGQCQDGHEKTLTDKIMKKTLSKIDDRTKGMVRTSALEKVLEKLNKGTSWVTIKGSPGEGKSTVAYMALDELHKLDRQVFQVSSPKEFSQVTETCSLPVIMLDDVFGNLEFDQSKWLLWEEVLHDVIDPKEHRSHEHQSKESVTVILVARDYVLNSASCNMGRMADFFTQDEHVVFMSNTVERGIQEKQAIWKSVSDSSGIVLDTNTVDKICHIKIPHGFPHVCRLFATIRKKSPKITAEEFFQAPLDFLNQTIVRFMHNKVKLFLFKELIKCDGKVSNEELGKLDGGFETLQTAFDLVGTYLRKEDNYFVFDHPSIYDSAAFNICRIYPLFVIDNCNMSFIHERVRIEPPCDTQHETYGKESGLVVYIPRFYVIKLAKRFADEISKLNLLQVFSHKEFRHKLFIKEVMSELPPLSEMITLADGKTGEKFLCVLVSNKSRQLLMYVHSHLDRQLTEDEISTVLYGVCKYAASDVLNYMTQIYDTLDHDIDARYGGKKQTPLMIAAETRDSQFVQDILSLNPDVNARDKYNRTAFHYLCENGLVSAVTDMIERVTDIDEKDMRGWSPLLYACRNNQTDMVKPLLNRGARIDWEVVTETCKYGSLEIMSLLFERGATVNMASNDGQTPLHSACETGNLKIIRYLIDKGASVNVQSEKSLRSPLHTACSRYKSHAIQCLLDHGADMECKNNTGDTPLYLAAGGGCKQSSDVLLRAGADVNVQNEDGDTPLHAAVENDCEECVDVLLKAGADFNVQNKHGDTPLHTAAAERVSGHIVDVLLKTGAGANVQNEDGSTPLHKAAGWGFKQCVDVLLKAGADVYAQNEDGDTPLHTAAGGWVSKQCVDVLLKAGAVANAKNENGSTPLHIAAGKGSQQRVDVLLKAGADVNVQNKHGDTPLHTAAACRGSEQCVDVLLKAGADVNVQNKHGQTPLHTAVYCKYLDYVQLSDISACDILISHRSDINKQDKEGNSPLHLLCLVHSHTTVCRTLPVGPASSYEDVYRKLLTLLTDNGADVNIHNNQGEPALRGWCQTLVRRKQSETK